MSDDIEMLRGFIRQAEQFGRMFSGDTLAALERVAEELAAYHMDGQSAAAAIAAAAAKLPCGHHVSSLVKSVESDAKFCKVCDLMSQRDDAVAMEERLTAERDALRKALDDRYDADRKAAKAIFVATGQTRGFPPNKETVAFYMAEVERLEEELEAVTEHRDNILRYLTGGAQEALESEIGWKRRAGTAERERDSFRAKFEKAGEALRRADQFITNGIDLGFIQMPDKDTPDTAHETPVFIRAVIAELSADAPSPPSQISDDLPFKFELKQPVRKVSGYAFDGHVRMRGRLAAGERYVVECEAAPGMLHIFSDKQLEARAPSITAEAARDAAQGTADDLYKKYMALREKPKGAQG